VGYTWAEFDSCFDADITAAICAEVAAASEPNFPRFDLPNDQGSILLIIIPRATPPSRFSLLPDNFKIFAYSIIIFIDLLHVYVLLQSL
jgi:hypothetical protein